MAEITGRDVIPNGAGVSHYLDKYASMKYERVEYDRKWQLVSDYELPRRDFSTVLRPNQLRPHRVVSSVATAAGARFAAFVLAYMIDPTRPNLLPSVKRGLAMAGRQTDLDDDGINYLGAAAWSVADHMMLPRAQLMVRLGAMLKEFAHFGCGVIWTGQRRGFGPYFNSRPLSACWWSENEEGEIDTLYFRMLLPIYRVLQRWPSASQVKDWEQKADRHDEQEFTPILLCVEPRLGGKRGAVGQAKPFKYVCIAEDPGVILEETGFDSFPYSVFRYDPAPGATYSEGPGCTVLPDVMVLNHLQEAYEDIISQKGLPPIAWPSRMFGKPLDRRPGAPNAYNPTGLGLQRPDQAIIKLDFTGDPAGVVDGIKYLTDVIERGFFVDWMTLRESGDMTAEEVNARTNIGLRGAATIVANCALPLTIMGDRILEGLVKEGMLPKPVPASVAGLNVDWEYAGPLAISQLQRNVQTILQLINARGLVAAQDAAAAEAIDLETCLRTIQASLAAPTGTINSKAKVEAARQAMAAKQEQEHEAAMATQAAKTGKDAAGAVSDMASVPQAANAGAGPGAAPFAPAAPLSQPVAA
jgi:hypothetical protein